ncbi:hypothetical protein GWK47_032319 [Chionoecetes opilio]|uniref:Ig-like domain-containing protein n=1 Tax=Chionoecetes opilio TaxID=41210 RepID=A0A8J4YUI9_CHIOP|nr:hypothetical protein GWK47_032319 [Chionoecetes opilio]
MAEGGARHLVSPLAPSRAASSLQGPYTPEDTYVEGQQAGYQIPSLQYLWPNQDVSPFNPLPHHWGNKSYHHRHHLPQPHSHHNHNHHHYSHHNHHLHRWENQGVVEEEAEEANEERLENRKHVNGGGISRRSSQSSSHHHHKHHRQKQIPTMKRRSSTSPGRGETGGYAFRVDEKSGVRRVIAVREVAEQGMRTAVEGVGSGSSSNSLLDLPQDDSTLGPPPGPSFDRNLPRNITMQKGQTAVLSCRVFNVNDKSVSWIRQDNLHILTVDKYKYSTDQRVSVVFNEPNLEWVLRIKSVATADAGTYECQVSTKPILSFVVNMRVVDKLPTPKTTPTPAPRQTMMMKEEEEVVDDEAKKSHNSSVPRAWILNSPEIYVHRGSPINLTCVVTHGTERPVFIYWYHHDKVIDYEGRGGVRIHTQNGRDTVSHLLVKKAGPRDTGRYSCNPSNGEPATVMLHVLNGEHQAAMQTNGATPLSGPRAALGILLLFLALLRALPQPQTLHL